jgi:hypothetical protein
MFLHDHTLKAALLVAVTLALSACGKQDEQPAPPTSTAASGPTFPTGNGDKPMTLADCDKLSNPKTADDSAAGLATAAAQGLKARADCKKEVAAQQDKPNADLARIREIKEGEEAERRRSAKSDEEFFKRIKEASKAPLRKFDF